ncbi:prepilin peptidase [Kiritimatiellaeota bacterium B1221]|nr:prepilin peptidase [Kiritimatiellaeota bacterium B1221]
MALFDPELFPPAYWQSPFVWGMVWVFGAIWGSFLNVCIYRIQKEMSVSWPGSHCFKCEKPIAWYDNIPVLSWFILRGKCRNCGTGFSMRYAIIEAITGALFLALWIVEGPSWVMLCHWLMTFGLLLGTGIDLDDFWIPDRVTWGGIIIGIPLSALVPALHGEVLWTMGLWASVKGAALGFGLLWLVGVLGKLAFKKDAMGFGDVKLLGAIGAFLGGGATLFVVFASALLGSIVGVSLILMGKSELGGRIPFGPYLSAAALIWLFGGDQLFDAYMNLVLPAGPGL